MQGLSRECQLEVRMAAHHDHPTMSVRVRSPVSELAENGIAGIAEQRSRSSRRPRKPLVRTNSARRRRLTCLAGTVAVRLDLSLSRLIGLDFRHLSFEHADPAMQHIDRARIHGFLKITEQAPKTRPPALGRRRLSCLAHLNLSLHFHLWSRPPGPFIQGSPRLE
jgi:hypothetical protein